MDQRVTFNFKRTELVEPCDGQECLVFNACDGYRIAEWYAPGNCFMVREQTLSPELALLWMELPDIFESDEDVLLNAKFLRIEVLQVIT